MSEERKRKKSTAKHRARELEKRRTADIKPRPAIYDFAAEEEAPRQARAARKKGTRAAPEREPREKKSAKKPAPGDSKPAESGWRSSRRSSKVGKTARKSARQTARVEARREKVAKVAGVGRAAAKKTARVAGVSIGSAVGVLVVLLLIALAINGFARWNAKRAADVDADPAVASKDNLLIVAVEDGAAKGFLALRVSEGEGQVFGIAIPDAAFMEVPGQGFESVGDSFHDGPDVSLAAVSNFFGMRFDKYIVVPVAAYQTALQGQDLSSVLDEASDTNMEEADVARFAEAFGEIDPQGVALVALPVKPISLGDTTYFEPQREEVADLVESFWGITLGSDDGQVSVIVYNGAGVPGAAGAAAQALISKGLRVVETRNADSFDYPETLIYLYSGQPADADLVKEILGVGRIEAQDASQQLADVIVIVGADYPVPRQDS